MPPRNRSLTASSLAARRAALQAALGTEQRAVVSRGTSITTTDEVWLAGEFEEMFSGLFHHRKTDNTTHVLDTAKFSEGTSVVASYFSS